MVRSVSVMVAAMLVRCSQGFDRVPSFAGTNNFARLRPHFVHERPQRSGCMIMQSAEGKQPSANGKGLFALGFVGASLGPSCDALHNQVLLEYDVLPVQIEAFGNVAKSSLLIPPLLAVTYCLLGGVFPALVRKVVGAGRLPSQSWQCNDSNLGARAALAVGSTAAIIRTSEMLSTSAMPTNQVYCARNSGMIAILFSSPCPPPVALNVSHPLSHMHRR